MQIMQIATRGRVSRLDEGGFTLIELLVSAGIAVALLALIAGIITSQGDTFSRQIVLGQMQANGRDAVDFLSRSIQNAGYNISRGSRFLAASDHYISTVFDEDDDGVIQSDEIIILSVSNATGQTTETFLRFFHVLIPFVLFDLFAASTTGQCLDTGWFTAIDSHQQRLLGHLVGILHAGRLELDGDRDVLVGLD